jgi:hypothetical protein
MPLMLSHMPVNHHLRPLYRFLAGLAGVYLLVFGIVGVAMTSGDSLFSRAAVSALGLRTNLAFAIASVCAGAVVLGAVFIGRNVDTTVTFWGGIAFMIVGTAMMAVLDSDLNKLNFGISTVIVSFVIGTLLFTAGMYIRSAKSAATAAHQAA